MHLKTLQDFFRLTSDSYLQVPYLDHLVQNLSTLSMDLFHNIGQQMVSALNNSVGQEHTSELFPVLFKAVPDSVKNSTELYHS